MARIVRAHTKKKYGEDARSNAWRSIRMLRNFSIGDLQATAEIHASNARKYTHALEKCGVVKLVRANRNGVAGSEKRWRLIRDLGPRAPIMRKNGALFDLNHGIVLDPRT